MQKARQDMEAKRFEESQKQTQALLQQFSENQMMQQQNMLLFMQQQQQQNTAIIKLIEKLTDK